MKKLEILRTVRLICYILIALIAARFILFDAALYHSIGSDRQLRTMAFLLWLILSGCFLFLLLDFILAASEKKAYRELVYAVNRDAVSGLGNRFGADSMIESFLDKPVPTDFCCIMLELSNLYEVNNTHGRLAGNTLIKDFSQMLGDAAGGWYVARNGGNKFIALLNPAKAENIDTFLLRVKRAVASYNESPETYSIRYRFGIAFHEPDAEQFRDITGLISLANRRIDESEFQ